MIKPQFLTRTFFDIYPDQTTFRDDLAVLGNATIKAMTQDQQDELYMLIAAKYGDSNVRYTNEHLFSMNLFKEINYKWPKVLAWQRDQERLREAETKDFQFGGKSVQNQGAHNTANVSTDTTEGINQLDAQVIVNSQRGELGVLRERLDAYRAGEEDKFVNSLYHLFMVVIAPMADLLYGTLKEEEE